MKTCFKCKVEKSVDDFHKCFNSKDGLFSYCKVCVSEIAKKYKFSRQKKYGKTLKGKAALARAQKKYCLKIKEKRNAYQLAYYYKKKEEKKCQNS